MDKLEQARKKINEIDEQMTKLFAERMQAVEMVAEYKKEHGLPVLDKAREDELLRKNAEKILAISINNFRTESQKLSVLFIILLTLSLRISLDSFCSFYRKRHSFRNLARSFSQF